MSVPAEIPREKLKELMQRNGEALLQDPDRCEGLLRDHCGTHRREISALIGALEERIPMELKSSWQTAMTPEAMRARLVQRLEDNRGLAPEIADWAVESWSYALGVGLGRKSDPVQSVLLSANQPQPDAAAGTGLVATGAGAAVGFAAAANADRVSSDRPGGSNRISDLERHGSAGLARAKVGLLGTTQKKAGAGAVAVLLLGGLGLLAFHHPTPVPDPNPTPIPQPTPDPTPKPNPLPTPSPKPNPGPNVEPPSVVHAKPLYEIPARSTISVRLNEEINSDNLSVGQILEGSVATAVVENGHVIIPQDSPAQLKVLEIDKSGKIRGRSQLQLELVSVSAGRRHLAVSGFYTVEGPSQGAKTAERAAIGGGAGALVGGLLGHLGHHGGTGAAIGATGGAAAGVLTNKPSPVKIHAETVLPFRLSRSVPIKS